MLREKILRRTYEQLRKLLGPVPGKTPTEKPDDWLKQWRREFPNVDFATPAAAGYPLSAEDVEALEGARILQCLHIGSSEVQNLADTGILPALFIDLGSDAVLSQPSEQSVQAVADVMPLTLRLILLEPPATERRYETTNPYLALRMHDAFDYLLDTGQFRGLKADAVGYQLPYQVFDAALVSADNFEGMASPYEIIDYRFEVQFTRQKERSTRQERSRR